MAAAGSVEDVVARLESWCLRAPKGFARVEFESAYARRAVLNRLQPLLNAQHLPLHEIDLASDSSSSLAEHLIRSVRCWESGVVSISGFEAALALSTVMGEADPTRSDAFSPADALRGLNFRREELARPSLRQIWWMTPRLAELFVQAAPDLDSWFMVRVSVAENVPAPAEEEGMIQEDGIRRGGVADARRLAFSLADRFRKGLAAGEPLDDLERTYALPALIALQRAGATSEVLHLARSMSEAVRRAETTSAQNGGSPGKVAAVETGNPSGTATNGERGYEEAEGFYRRAVGRAEKLGESDQGELGASLTYLGNLYGDLGRRREALRAAEQATEIYQRLAAENPAIFGPNLAMSFTNLGNRYSDLGRRVEALRAAELGNDTYQRLAAQNPEAFESHLATSLNNLAKLYSDLGRREQALQVAERALEIRERLAAQNPEAFEPDLASSLHSLSNRYSALGRGVEALQVAERAVEIRERLAAQNPDVFEPNLATSLNSLATFYGNLGRHAEGLRAAERAVRIRERLAAQNPDAYEPALAMSLNNLGILHSYLGRREEALREAEQASEIYQRLAARTPDAFEAYWAGSLNNLANRYNAVARREEALREAERASQIYEPLAAQNPDAFEEGLAQSIGTIGQVLSDGEPRRAIGAYKRAIETLQRLFLRNPQAFQALMGSLVLGYLQACERIGDEPDAALLAPIQEAMRRLDSGQLV